MKTVSHTGGFRHGCGKTDKGGAKNRPITEWSRVVVGVDSRANTRAERTEQQTHRRTENRTFFLETRNSIVRRVRESLTAEQRFGSDIVVFADWNESEAETLNVRICSAVVFFSFDNKLRKRVGTST